MHTLGRRQSVRVDGVRLKLRRLLLATIRVGVFALASCTDEDGDLRAIPAVDAALDAGDASAPDAGPPAPVGVTPASEDDHWVSYGNGPSSLFANPGENRLSVHNADRLELKWKIDSEVTSPPVVVHGRVYVTTAAQGLLAIDIAGGDTVWQHPEVSSFSGPAYDPKTD